MISSVSIAVNRPVGVRMSAAPIEMARPAALTDRVDLGTSKTREPDPVSSAAGAMFGGVIASQIAIPIGMAAAGGEGALLFGAAAAISGATMGWNAGFKHTAITSLGALAGTLAGSAIAGLPGRAIGGLAGGFIAHKLAN